MITGTAMGTIQYFIYPYFGGNLPQFTPLLILLIPLGALIGDIIGSLIKRQLKTFRLMEKKSSYVLILMCH